jgi:hypothetical protein
VDYPRRLSVDHPAIPSASMNRPPKSDVASIRPVRIAVRTTADRLNAAAAKARRTAAFWADVGSEGTGVRLP